VNGKWSTTCAGEVKPEAMETCSDNADHNCNHLPGCLDIFACVNDPVCQNNCNPSMVDPGCVCPQGAGDQAMCPGGYLGMTPTGSGGGPCLTDANCPMGQSCFFFMCTNFGTLADTECCPCTAKDCGNAGCCGEAVCLNDPQCRPPVQRPDVQAAPRHVPGHGQRRLRRLPRGLRRALLQMHQLPLRGHSLIG
jgi:hypothetical protein